jgi:heme/copper-type cytochrome/quinol oxidase subunit 2
MDEKVYGWWLPPDVSMHGAKIDQLMSVLHWFMLLLFVGWGAFFIYCLFKYRARPGHSAIYAPVAAIATKYIEGAVVVVEVFLLFALSTPVWLAYKNNPPKDAEAVHVRLVAEQFAWNFQYPGKDGKFGKTDPSLIGGDNPLGIDPEDKDGKDDSRGQQPAHPRPPADDRRHLSKDVIHSFNIPCPREAGHHPGPGDPRLVRGHPDRPLRARLRPALRPRALPHARGRADRLARGLRQVGGGERAAAARGPGSRRARREEVALFPIPETTR